MTDKSVLAMAAAGLGVMACCQALGRSAAPTGNLSPQKAAELKKQLVEEGYCVVPGAMSRAEIAEIAEMSHELLAAPENQQFQEDKFTGSLVPLSKHPSFAKLIAHRATLGALSALGFQPPRWLSGFIISKPPGGPSLGWHQVPTACARTRLLPESCSRVKKLACIGCHCANVRMVGTGTRTWRMHATRCSCLRCTTYKIRRGKMVACV
jgi:hypothetical protein